MKKEYDFSRGRRGAVLGAAASKTVPARNLTARLRRSILLEVDAIDNLAAPVQFFQVVCVVIGAAEATRALCRLGRTEVYDCIIEIFEEQFGRRRDGNRSPLSIHQWRGDLGQDL